MQGFEMGRDKTLDLMRGWAVFHMFFMHILYWLGFCTTGVLNLLKSWLLFTMAVYFFVTGAVNIAAKRRPWGSFVIRRAKVLMVPYYVYAVLSVLIAGAVYLVEHRFSFELLGRTALSWALPLDQQIMPLPFFTWATWFVPVYLSVMITFPLVRRAVERIGCVTTVIVLSAVYLSILSVKPPDLVQKAFYYPIFAAIGTQWPELKHRDRKKIRGAAALMVFGFSSLIACKYLLGGTFDMQVNKFPPNHLYLLFNFGAIGALYIALPYIARVWRMIRKLVPWMEKLLFLYSGYSVYAFLYQSFAYIIAMWLLNVTGLGRGIPAFLLSAVVVFPIATFTLWLFSWLEERKGNLRKT